MGASRDFLIASAEMLFHADDAVHDITTEDFTIGAWFNTANAGNMSIITKRDGFSATGWGIWVDQGFGDGIVFCQFQGATNEATLSAASAGALNDGAWHHVAVAVDRSSLSTSDIYIDGVSIANGTGTMPTDTLANARQMRIGSTHTGASSLFEGALAYAFIIKRLLSVDEVNELMWRPLSIPDMAGSWPIWGNDSPEVDVSGNGKNMTLNGTPTESFDGPPVMIGAHPQSTFFGVAAAPGGVFIPQLMGANLGADTYNGTFL